MPYIRDDNQRRRILDPTVGVSVPRRAQNVGELNFQISRLLDDYVQRKGLSYETLNAVRGVLGCATDEFYRRVAAPYEDRKIKENGDVY
jgi:hypothetical protein